MGYQSDPFAVALADLIAKRDSLKRQWEGIEAIIARIREAQGASQIPPTQEGEFRNKKLGPALEAYLRQRAGFTIPIEQVVEDLKRAGAVFSKSQKPEQTLKIAAWNRKNVVTMNQHNFDFSLAPTAGDPLPPRKRSPKKSKP